MAENGKEAVDTCRDCNFDFDIILMDIQMPVLDGYQATVVMRQMERQKKIHTPIIAMTTSYL